MVTLTELYRSCVEMGQSYRMTASTSTSGGLTTHGAPVQ
ncbi:unnamed protein product [Staurois parvus]|uniref:Uncharacterized protein n=1 Tax=Staurois parvus TaxID=386267 RepID=A0ABN9CGT5_9NEOB|nr:unnamed protein product [Staurois parvus]